MGNLRQLKRRRSLRPPRRIPHARPHPPLASQRRNTRHHQRSPSPCKSHRSRRNTHPRHRLPRNRRTQRHMGARTRCRTKRTGQPSLRCRHRPLRQRLQPQRSPPHRRRNKTIHTQRQQLRTRLLHRTSRLRHPHRRTGQMAQPRPPPRTPAGSLRRIQENR